MSDGAAVLKEMQAPVKLKKVLVLRSCGPDGSSYNGKWKYPLTEGAIVEAPDWNDRPECGGGFHGHLWGIGDVELLCWDPKAWWQVFEVDSADMVVIDDKKVKFRRGKQVFLRQGASPGYPLARAYIIANRPKPPADSPASTAGYGAPASTAGYGAPASTAGECAPASTAGVRAPASTAGYGAPASTAGECAPASTAGECAPASATGKASIAGALGFESKVKAGPDGCIVVAWWDEKKKRPRVAVGYVGEDGIKQDTWYRADEKGCLKEVAW